MSVFYQAAKIWLETADQRADSRDQPIEMAQAYATLALVEELEPRLLDLDDVRRVGARYADHQARAELETLSSRNTDGTAGPHALGSTVSWTVNFQHAPAMGNLKAFLMAVVERLTGAPCSEAGVEIDCEAFNITTKGKGQPFTKCLWKATKAA